MQDACIFALFILLQIADGTLTWYGINRTPVSIGIGYEANPVVAFFVQNFNDIAALASLKIISIILGAILYYHRNLVAFAIKASCYLYGLTMLMAIVTIVNIVSIYYLS